MTGSARPVASGSLDLGRVGAESGDLPVDRGRHVHPRVAPFRPEQVQPAHVVGGQPGPGQPREGHRIAGRRIDGVDGGDPRGPVVGVVHATTLVEDGVRIGGEHRVGPKGPDLANELLAQGEVVGKRAVRPVEECHAGVADDRGRGALLRLTRGREGQRVGIGVLATLVAARAAHQPALGAGVDPTRGRAGRPEICIVGMGRDDHESEGAPSVVGGRGRLRHRLVSDGFEACRACCTGWDTAVRFGPRLRSSPPTGEASRRGRRITSTGPPGAYRAPPGRPRHGLPA